MRLLLLSALVSLITTGSSWAWPPRTYVVVGPGPTYMYMRPALLSPPQIVTYAQPAAITYAQPTPTITYAQPAVQMPMADDAAAALARLQAEVRQLTQESNVRALQSRMLEVERRQAVAPK